MAEHQLKEVKLHGSATSGFCMMVHYALKLKGIAYDYSEEDLKNKSEALLHLNPVHKKVPHLIVDGKPIAESFVILQFIDDAWQNPPYLLPQNDPFKRTKLRFWGDFVYQKLVPLTYAIRSSEGYAKKKAAEEFMAHLITMENGVREELWSEGPFVNGDEPGLLDVIMGSCYRGLRYLEDAQGVKLVEKEKTPLLCSSMDAFLELDAIKERTIYLQECMQAFKERKSKA
ncbi:hypothetical protein Cni_G14266 [Canna indica]|uniref:Glutathione S-transferase n=1 Tax=Canna indica TaxID=4628 RepID=A0AAQ3KG05_9LILI|nr:hypothetical protein Cni_G14266 [Canna indica]